MPKKVSPMSLDRTVTHVIRPCQGACAPQSQPTDTKPAADFCHLRLGECLALLDGAFHTAQNNFFEKFYVVRIDNRFVKSEPG
jgi:hypothetical protein